MINNEKELEFSFPEKYAGINLEFDEIDNEIEIVGKKSIFQILKFSGKENKETAIRVNAWMDKKSDGLVMNNLNMNYYGKDRI